MKLPTYQELSKEQDEINGLPLDGNWLVTGPPGTGKSVMALYRSRMLSDRRRPVTMIVWSRLLRMYVETAFASLDLDPRSISTFDSWLFQFWKANGFGGWRVPYRGDNTYDYDWDAIHDSLNEKGVPKGTPDMIIDEGQDLPNGFYLFVRNLCDHLTVFADEAQTISERRQSSVAEIQRLARIKETFVLRKNYRNSRQIAEVARHFFCGSPEETPELPDDRRTGPRPSTRRFDTWQESAARVSRWATNHESETVGVFLPNVKLAKKFAAELERHGAPHVQLYHRASKKAPEIDFDVSGILVSYFTNAKGLEFDAVFVAELQASRLPVHDPLTKNLLYVLASRARSNLEFHWSGEGRPELLAVFPPDLVRSQ
jgi:DNA helicase IV